MERPAARKRGRCSPSPYAMLVSAVSGGWFPILSGRPSYFNGGGEVVKPARSRIALEGWPYHQRARGTAARVRVSEGAGQGDGEGQHEPGEGPRRFGGDEDPEGEDQQVGPARGEREGDQGGIAHDHHA